MEPIEVRREDKPDAVVRRIVEQVNTHGSATAIASGGGKRVLWKAAKRTPEPFQVDVLGNKGSSEKLIVSVGLEAVSRASAWWYEAS